MNLHQSKYVFGLLLLIFQISAVFAAPTLAQSPDETKKYLYKPAKQEVTLILNQEKFPDQIENIIKLRKEDAKTIFKINNDWVVVCPKDALVASAFQRYIAFSPLLKRKTSLAIPHCDFIGTKHAIYGYKIIQGRALSKDLYLKARSNSKVPAELAEFIKSLHATVDYKTAEKLGYKYYNVSEIFNFEAYRKNLALDDKTNDALKKALVEFKKVLEKNTDLVLCHSDLHGANLIVSENGLNLNGIIDFDEMVLAPKFVEFGKMHHLSSEFARDVIDQYEKNPAKRKELLQASELEYIARRVSYYLMAINDKDEQLQKYHKEVLIEFLKKPLAISTTISNEI